MRDDPPDRTPLKIGKLALDVWRAKKLDPLDGVGLELYAVSVALRMGHLTVDGGRAHNVGLKPLPLLQRYLIGLFHSVRGCP